MKKNASSSHLKLKAAPSKWLPVMPWKDTEGPRRPWKTMAVIPPYRKPLSTEILTTLFNLSSRSMMEVELFKSLANSLSHYGK